MAVQAAVPERLMYSVAEAVQKLGLPRTRVYEAMACGDLFSVKVGRSRRIPAHALERYVAKLCEEQTAY